MFFDREAASSHYRNQSDHHIQTLTTAQLVDSESCAVLDLHCLAHWPHNTLVGRQVALRNPDELKSLAGDKGNDDQSFRGALRSGGVRPLIRHRLFTHYDYAYNARLDSDLDGKRWMVETEFSAIKRGYGSAGRPSAWYRQFRELLLTATVYNLG